MTAGKREGLFCRRCSFESLRSEPPDPGDDLADAVKQKEPRADDDWIKHPMNPVATLDDHDVRMCRVEPNRVSLTDNHRAGSLLYPPFVHPKRHLTTPVLDLYAAHRIPQEHLPEPSALAPKLSLIDHQPIGLNERGIHAPLRPKEQNQEQQQARRTDCRDKTIEQYERRKLLHRPRWSNRRVVHRHPGLVGRVAGSAGSETRAERWDLCRELGPAPSDGQTTDCTTILPVDLGKIKSVAREACST